MRPGFDTGRPYAQQKRKRFLHGLFTTGPKERIANQRRASATQSPQAETGEKGNKGEPAVVGSGPMVSSKVISPAATKAMSLGVITASLVMLYMQRAGLRFPNETPAQIDEYDPPRAAINNVLNEITREVDAIDQHLGNNASDIPNLECN